jgi:3-oxoacyl-[acyl-carrier-protein] synthase II
MNGLPVAPSRPVAVVGLGLATPAGSSADTLWASLCAGRATARPCADERLPPLSQVLVCRVDDFDPAAYVSPMELRRFDRAHQLAIGAAQDALDAFGPDRPPAARCAVVCGVGLGAASFQELQYARLNQLGPSGLGPLTIPMMMPSALAALLSLRFGFKGPCSTVCTACASGAAAIAQGTELIRRGAADLVLAGGADSLVAFSALAGFLRLDVMSRRVDAPELASRPFDAERDGFVMGEGAGFVVLQRPEDARAQGRRIRGHICGHASNADAHNLVAPSPGGEGALDCMRAALLDAGVAASDISHVNAHAAGTPQGDLAEALALQALFGGSPGQVAGPPVTAVKGCTGHLIGGSGAVEAIVTLCSLEAALVPPIAGLQRADPRLAIDLVTGTPRPIRPGPALSNSFGFGGMNTALVIGPA